MVFDAIAAHVQDVHDDLKRLISRALDLPDSNSVGYVEGPSASVARQFTHELARVAQHGAVLTSAVLEDLENTDSAIRATLDEFAAQEDEIALGAEQLGDAMRDAGYVKASTPKYISPPGAERSSWGGSGQGSTLA